MINKYALDQCFDYENGFYLTSDMYRLGNILSHYELYKMIVNLPGDVIELGVFKGASFIQFCTFRELLENEQSRKIVGFDIFGEFPMQQNVVSDRQFISDWNKQFDDEFLSKEDLEKSLSHKGIGNAELIAGDINLTLEKYIEQTAPVHANCIAAHRYGCVRTCEERVGNIV